MKNTKSIIIIAMLLFIQVMRAQVVITNTRMSFGTTGRIGVGASPTGEGNMWKPLNLNGQGSLGGRMEQVDYMDLLPALHFTPMIAGRDCTNVTFQVRLGMYSQNGQFMGNTSTRTMSGLTFILPETYIEGKNILGSKWSAWAGVRFRRYDDIHISDYFYFDDHSAQGFGFSHKNTEIAMYMPANTDSAGVYPYNYAVNIGNSKNAVIRQRQAWVIEHSIFSKNGSVLKLLGEFHHVAGTSEKATIKYAADNGWVIGAKYNNDIKTALPGSFNQFSMRYGHGIANGGDNGTTYTWSTYGAPDENGKYTNAYSFTTVEHFLLNLSRKLSLNGYGVFTKSKGGADSDGKATYFNGNQIYNRKTDFVVGMRGLFYATNWLHLLGEAHYAIRKDGINPNAEMMKFDFAPTIVPLGKRDPWCRPHIRLVFSLARYNDFAKNNQYSPWLQINQKQWGTYIGVKTEWWIF
ncbi:MAG: carbohydrate porin [Bacteroidota bacterium]|nr:carbohydrate porin [Bacteroidota bacterium]